uniref:Uncharacterized protein n=1 Tax=Anguilla anguilla TaxID=7936 RepID=A0A0E9PLP4_ANGAN
MVTATSFDVKNSICYINYVFETSQWRMTVSLQL